MLSLRTWRAALAALSLPALVATGTSAAAGQTAPSDRAHYCRRVDAYRITTCATALLPASPLGRQLRWVLAQLAGEATTLTQAEVQAHFSAEFFAVRGQELSPTALVAAFQHTITERGTFTLVGFAYPPRARQALALVQSSTGERGAIEIGVTNRRPAQIEYFSLQEAPPTIVPKGCQDHPNGPWSRSDPAPTPRTARDFVADLHTLLRVAGVPGPYVLAGHSNGGLYSQLSASTHPGQVAGLVLIDAVHPAYHRRRLAMLKPLLPPEVWQALRREAMTPQPRLLDPERVDIWASERQTRVALRRSRLRPMPLVVLAHGRPEDPGGPFVEQDERLWRHLQRELAHLVPGGRLVIAATSGHDIQHQQPELVLDAIGDVVQAVRAETRFH